jgi:xylose isomerase
MLEVLKAGGFANGGLNFDAKTRRGSFRHEDILLSYIAGMDTFALGLRLADKIIEDGRLDAFVRERYSGYSKGLGADIRSGRATIQQLEDHALSLGEVSGNMSGAQEMLESFLNEIFFG